MGGEDCAVRKCGCEICAHGEVWMCTISANACDVDMCKVDATKYRHLLLFQNNWFVEHNVIGLELSTVVR